MAEYNKNDAVVEVRDLTRTFGNFVAVDHVSFSVKSGGIFGFLGPNGAGKSTTIRMLCGILLPTSGSGRVAGFDILSEPEAVKKHIGYMSQKFSLYPDLTAGENMDFYAGIYGVKQGERKERIARAVDLVGLGGRLNDLASILTGGWRQRLALACALLHRPPVIFLDEPTAGVDPISRRDFWRIIQGLSREGTTVFVTTHYMDEAEYCHTLVLISGGKIMAMGTPDELKSSFSWPIMSLSTPRMLETMKALETVPAVGDVSIWGDSLHVVFSDPQNAERQVREVLRVAGIEVLKLERVEPSLEDVFVTLVTGGKK
ncbi:MAG: ABC transporter ATP-binding protein [bacterium]